MGNGVSFFYGLSAVGGFPAWQEPPLREMIMILLLYMVSSAISTGFYGKNTCCGAGSLLYQLLVVDHQFKLHSQLFCGFPTQEHAAHEDLKVVHYGTKLGVNS